MRPIKLCALKDLSETGVKGIVIGAGLEQRRFIILGSGGEVRCYLNECPHQGTPLDTFPDKFLDETGAFLVCSTHGARFNADDGVCVSGPCVGQGLKVCGISIREEQVYLVEEPHNGI